jgi:hypothetical protein
MMNIAISPATAKVRHSQVYLMRGPVGTGKTEDIIKGNSERQHTRLNSGKKAGQIVGFTPRHDLNDEVADRWETASHLVAATIVGRTAKDPRHAKPGKADPNWCRYPALVETAQDHGLPVKETCCISKNSKCNHLPGCGFMAQFEAARNADLVLMPHALLPHQQDELPGKPHSMFIDEDFLDALIFELPKPKSGFRFEVDDVLMEATAASKFNFDFPKLKRHRKEEHDCLRLQVDAGELGGVQKKFFNEEGDDGVTALAFNPKACSMARYLEFKLSPQLDELQPNLKGSALERCKKRNAKKLLQRARHMFMVEVWDALHELMECKDVETSGRVFLYEDEHSGRICIGVRGLRPIVQQWRARKIIVASATMPPIEIIAHAFPDCDIIPDEVLEVALPEHTRIIQIIDTPTAKHRTVKKSNQEALRRFIMDHARKLGMPSTLVGVQKHVEDAFAAMNPQLPPSITVKHFNAVAGLNGFKNVGLMISIGRAAPSPLEIEDQIAAITGRDPQRLPEGDWFMKAKGTIKLRDGSEVKVDCYMHPDPIVEAWRRHKHTSCVIQMIGRARPYNRTADNPLTIYVLSNEPLDIPVDEVLDWEKDELEPLALVEPMACDGFVVLAPEALSTLWPTVFESKRSGERELQRLRDSDNAAGKRIQAILATWRRFTVQKPGARQKRRDGFYDPARFDGVEGLRSALELGLGPDLQLKEG